MAFVSLQCNAVTGGRVYSIRYTLYEDVECFFIAYIYAYCTALASSRGHPGLYTPVRVSFTSGNASQTIGHVQEEIRMPLESACRLTLPSGLLRLFPVVDRLLQLSDAGLNSILVVWVDKCAWDAADVTLAMLLDLLTAQKKRAVLIPTRENFIPSFSVLRVVT